MHQHICAHPLRAHAVVCIDGFLVARDNALIGLTSISLGKNRGNTLGHKQRCMFYILSSCGLLLQSVAGMVGQRHPIPWP
jgi:hypothetical protein